MDEDLQTIEQSFEMIPEEVKSYIYSDSFSNSFDTLCIQEKLSDGAKKSFHADLYQYIAQVLPEDSLVKTIYSISSSIESSQRIIAWIKVEVTQKVIALSMRAYEKDIPIEEGEEEQEIPSSIPLPIEKAPSPIEALAMIKDRLTKGSAIASTKRDYSAEPELSTTPSPKSDLGATVSQGIKSIDPYREFPEKE